MKVILKNSIAEVVEKKSRFIANIFYVKDIFDAEKELQAIRKKYYDARHNCYAYIIGINGETEKASDDGEPSGTAGRPILDVLKGSGLTNCMAIVTRYFGGTLLGTGGLVRSYSESVKKALDEKNFASIVTGYENDIVLNYDDYGKYNNIIDDINVSDKKILEVKKDFDDKVRIKVIIENDIFQIFDKKICDLTKGSVKMNKDNSKVYYLDKNCDIIFI